MQNSISRKELLEISVANPAFFEVFLDQTKGQFQKTYGEDVDKFIGEALAKNGHLIQHVNNIYLEAHPEQLEAAIKNKPAALRHFTTKTALLGLKAKEKETDKDAQVWLLFRDQFLPQILKENPQFRQHIPKDLGIKK